jgi:HEPN domain-containing protein
MAIPQDKDAKRFYRAAEQRWEDATFLFSEGVRRTTAAVYLAGYCVECLLKSLILSQAAKTRRAQVLQLFRGSKAHDYDWLRDLYYERKGARFPPEVVEAFSKVSVWGTEMRYQPGTIPDDDADEFLTAVKAIWDWAEGRL